MSATRISAQLPDKALISPLLAALLVFGGAEARAAEDARACASALNSPIERTIDEGRALSPVFEILSWNIQKASNSGWSYDLAGLTAGADLVFIQEAALQASIPGTVERAKSQAFAPGYRTSTLDTGVMTLSTAPPSVHCRLTATEPWLGTPKATSVTEHAIAGSSERLLAINLHAVNFTLGLNDFAGQFDAIGVVLEQHSGPVIFAGDMNTWSNARQALVDDFMKTHGLRPVSFEPDLRTTAFGRTLDHVYVRGLRAESAAVIPVESSDHNPLQVLLALDS
jgi:endonuclease/exonuclease/phosphatase (EEP) superfamily protein YafD